MSTTGQLLTGGPRIASAFLEEEEPLPPPDLDPGKVRAYSSHLLAEKNVVDNHLNPLVSHYANVVSGEASAVRQYGRSDGPVREPATEMLNYIEATLDQIEDPVQAERWVATTFGDQAQNAMFLLNLQAGARSGRIYKNNQELFQNYSNHLRQDNEEMADILRQYQGEPKATPLYGLAPGGERITVTPTLNRDFNRRLGKVITPDESILIRLDVTPELEELYRHMGPDAITPDQLRLIVDRDDISEEIKNGIFTMYNAMAPVPGGAKRGQVLLPIYRDEYGQGALDADTWLEQLEVAALSFMLKRETGKTKEQISNEEFIDFRDERRAEARQMARRIYARALDDSGIPVYGQMTHKIVEDQIKSATQKEADVRQAYESLGPMFEAKKELASAFSRWGGTLGFAFKTGSKRLPSAAFQLEDMEMEGDPDFQALVGHLQEPFRQLDDNYQMLEDRDQGWWHYARALNPMESFGAALYLAEKKRTDKGLPLNTVDTFADAWKEGGSADHYRTLASMEEHGDLWLVDQLGQYLALSNISGALRGGLLTAAPGLKESFEDAVYQEVIGAPKGSMLSTLFGFGSIESEAGEKRWAEMKRVAQELQKKGTPEDQIKETLANMMAVQKRDEVEGLEGWFDESVGLVAGIAALIRNPDAIYAALLGTARVGGAGVRQLRGVDGTAQAKAKAAAINLAAQDVNALEAAGKLNPYTQSLSELNATLEVADRGDGMVRGLVSLAYNATVMSAKRGLQHVGTILRSDRNVHRVQQGLRTAATEADDVRFAAETELAIKTAEKELKILQKVRAQLLLEIKRVGPLWEYAANAVKTLRAEGVGELKAAADTAVDLLSDAGRRRATVSGLETAARQIGIDPHKFDTGMGGTGHYLNELRIRISSLDDQIARAGLKGDEAKDFIRNWFRKEFSPERWAPSGLGKAGAEGERAWPAMDIILYQRYRDLIKGLARNNRAIEGAEKLINLRLIRQAAGVAGDPGKMRAAVLGMKDSGKPLTKADLEKTAAAATKAVNDNFTLLKALEEADNKFKLIFMEFLSDAANAVMRATKKGGDLDDVVAPAYLGVFDTIGRLSREFDLKTLESILVKMEEQAPKQYAALNKMLWGGLETFPGSAARLDSPEKIARQLLMIKGMDDLWTRAPRSEKGAKAFVSVLTGAVGEASGLGKVTTTAALLTGYALRTVRNSWSTGTRKDILETITKANPDYFDAVVSESVQQAGRRVQQTALGISSDLANLETRAGLEARRLGPPEMGARLDKPDSQFYKFFQFLTSSEPIFAPAALRVPKAAGETLAEAASPAARISSHQSPDGPIVSVALDYLLGLASATDKAIESPSFLNFVASLVRTEADLLPKTKSALNEGVRRAFSDALRTFWGPATSVMLPRQQIDSLIDAIHNIAREIAPRVGVEPDAIRLIDPRVMDSAESLTELGDFTRALGALRLEAKVVSAFSNASGARLTTRSEESYNAWLRGGDYIKDLYKNRDFELGDLVYLAEDTLRVSENLGGLTLADLAGHTARMPGDGTVFPAAQEFISESWRIVKVDDVADVGREYTLIGTKSQSTKVVTETELSFGVPELWFEDALAPVINWGLDSLPAGVGTKLRAQAARVEADSRMLQSWRTENGFAQIPAFVTERLLSSGDGLMLDLLRAARREGVGGEKLAASAFFRQLEGLLAMRRGIWVWGAIVPKAAHVGMVAAGNLAGSVVVAAGGPEGRAIGTSLRAGGEFILQGVVEAVPLLKQATINLRNRKYEKVRDELGAAAAEGLVPPTVDHGILANPFLEKVLAGTSDVIPTPHGDKTGLELLEIFREAGGFDHIFKMDQIELARWVDTALDTTKAKEAFLDTFGQLIPNSRNVLFEAAGDLFAEYMVRTRLATFLELYINQGASLAKAEEYLRLANYTTQNSMTTAGDRLLKSAFSYWGWFKQATAQAWHIQFSDAGLGTAEQVARWARGGTAYQKLRLLQQSVYKLSQPGEGDTLTAEEMEDIARRMHAPQWAKDRNLNITGTGEMVPITKDSAVNEWYGQFKTRPDYFLSSAPLDPIDGVNIWLDFTLVPTFSMAQALIPEEDLPATIEQRDKFNGLVGSLSDIVKDQLIPELQVLFPNERQQYGDKGAVHLTYSQYRTLQLFGRAGATQTDRDGQLTYTPGNAADRILLSGGRSLNSYLLKNIADMSSLIMVAGGYSDADINRLAALDPETARFVETAREQRGTWGAFVKQLVAVIGLERKYFTDFDKNQQATQKMLESTMRTYIKAINGEAQQLSDGVTPPQELSKDKSSSQEEED